MSKKIKIGDQIPAFSLPDQHGNTVSISDTPGRALVIYFYPKDDTPGCTKEACAFRDQYEDFTAQGAEVIGISNDSPASHLRFAQKHNLNFTLLSDQQRKVEKLFGVPRTALGFITGRVTYVVAPNGKVVHFFNSLFQAEKHIREALKAIKAIS